MDTFLWESRVTFAGRVWTRWAWGDESGPIGFYRATPAGALADFKAGERAF